MDVGGYLNIFTTAYGWHFYGVLWDILVGTGLVFLPLLGIVFDHASKARSYGTMLNVDGDRALAGFEVEIATVFLVLLLAGVPTSLTTLTPGTSLTYYQQDTVTSDALEVTQATPADQSSEYHTAFSDEALATTGVKVPAWWYLVINVSAGISYALTNSIASGDGYRAIKRAVDTASITDEDLRQDVNVFYTDCYLRAMSSYRSDRVEDPNFEAENVVAGTQHADTVKRDVNWIGSKYLYDNYYGGMTAQRAVPGFDFDAVRDTQFDSATAYGTPTCTAYWDKIEQTIWDNANDDGLVGLIDKFRDQGSELAASFGAENSTQVKREVALTYLHKTPKQLTPTADQLIATKDAGAGFLSKAAGAVGQIGTSSHLIGLVATVEMVANSLIDGLVTLQAYMLLLIYIFIPIGMLVSRYSIAFLMQMGLVIFTISMWPAVWAIASWLDNNLADALFGGQSAAATFMSGGFSELNRRLVHSITVVVLYISGPAVFAWILSAAGSRVGYISSQASAAASGGAYGGQAQMQGSGNVAMNATKVTAGTLAAKVSGKGG